MRLKLCHSHTRICKRVTCFSLLFCLLFDYISTRGQHFPITMCYCGLSEQKSNESLFWETSKVVSILTFLPSESIWQLGNLRETSTSAENKGN